MWLVARCSVAIVVCLGLSYAVHGVYGDGAHGSVPLAGRSPHPFPTGAVRLYRTAADGGTLQGLDPRSLADLAGSAFHTGLHPQAYEYPAIVATSTGARFATMYNIHPNPYSRASRAQDQMLQVFDAVTGLPLFPRHHPAVPIWMTGISADGSVVYGFDANVDPTHPCAPSPFYLLDARTGRVIRQLTIAAQPWETVLVGPNLQRLYTMTVADHIDECSPRWSYSPTIRAYDLRTGRAVHVLRLKGVPAGRWETNKTINGELVGGDWTPGFALSPDGSQLAVLDGHSNRLILMGAQSLRVAGTESVYRPQAGLEALVAALGLWPVTAEAKGQWNGATLQMQYTADGRSLLVTGARLHPDRRHLYASSRSLGIQLIDLASGRIRAWLNDGKQVLGLWPAPDGSAVYSTAQGWSRQAGWEITLRRHDFETLRVDARRVFEHMGNWWVNLLFLRGHV